MNKEHLRNEIELKKIKCCNQFFDQKKLPTLQALDFNYIGLNSYHPKWIILDINNKSLPKTPEQSEEIYGLDHTGLLPIPTLSIKNKKTNDLTYCYKLTTSINKNNPKEFNYFESIKKYMKIYMLADGYDNYLIENPLSDNNESVYHGEQYDLYDLKVDLPASMRQIKTFDTTNEIGRNCFLFDDVRFTAYAKKKNYSNYDSFYNFIENELINLNNLFSIPLNFSEVKSIAKSISTWVWYKYQGNNRGRDSHKTAFLTDLKDKQLISAIETNKQRKNSTKKLIDDAILKINKTNKIVTNIAIQKLTKIGRKTISNHLNNLTNCNG